MISSNDAHAWVEVLFDNAGWVRFDPTPLGGGQGGQQGFTDGRADDGGSPVDVGRGDHRGGAVRRSQCPTRATSAAPTRGIHRGSSAERRTSPRVSTTLWWLLAIALVLAAAAAGPTVVRNRRRMRRRSTGRSRGTRGGRCGVERGRGPRGRPRDRAEPGGVRPGGGQPPGARDASAGPGAGDAAAGSSCRSRAVGTRRQRAQRTPGHRPRSATAGADGAGRRRGDACTRRRVVVATATRSAQPQPAGHRAVTDDGHPAAPAASRCGRRPPPSPRRCDRNAPLSLIERSVPRSVRPAWWRE